MTNCPSIAVVTLCATQHDNKNCILRTERIYRFRMILKINEDYFLTIHELVEVEVNFLKDCVGKFGCFKAFS
jgi:hypothetical protein